MKVIGYATSPRRAGNTAWAVDTILAGAGGRGAETQALYASDLNIGPCRGCLGCVQSGRCIQKDDMQDVYQALQGADALVLGAPIYMGQMSAQAKTFVDRLFAQITPRFSPRFKEENAGKKLVLAFTQGNPDAEKFRPYYDYTRATFGMLEFNVRDLTVVTGTRSRPAWEDEAWRPALEAVGAALLNGQK